jgi:hypothetical protein
VRTWSREQWEEEQSRYHAVVEPWVRRRRDRRSRGEKHPVEDFIWEYYSLRGGKLMQWSPGSGVALHGATMLEFPDRDAFRSSGDARYLDVQVWCAKRRSGVKWILNLLKRTRDRMPEFGCLGLHEWAMVYELRDKRHVQVPLRLPHSRIREVVDSLPLQCTHFDAFRFFSESSRPLNRKVLTAEGRPQQEQPGCLHANMDLFKWCMKLQPLAPSSLVAECFHLACEARIIDMRATPYDLSAFGLDPLTIETPDGRRDYVRFQKEIARNAEPLRDRLIDVLEDVFRCDPDCAARDPRSPRVRMGL